MRIELLGPLRVTNDGHELTLGGQRNHALVARLALDAGRPVSAGLLVDDLWGLDVPAHAQNALQSVVSRTRRALPEGALLSTPAGYVLQAADVDALAFERLLSEGATREALDLWRGAPLAGLDGFPFAARAASRLDELRLGALERDLAQQIDRGDVAPAIVALADLTIDHPYREGFWALYLRALVAAGRSVEALTAYETLRRQLADDLGTDPSYELQQLHLAILRGDAAPEPRPLMRLPVGLTTFVGRDDAMADVSAALADHRLVTLLGPGGAGKTRLAIEAARAQEGRLGDVWLVELAPVTGDEDILVAIAAAMGLLELSVLDRDINGPRRDVHAKLREALQDKRGLLVLDNCEHVIDAAAVIVEDLLAHAAYLKILATSREPLRLMGELGYQVASLAQPPEGCSAEEAAKYSAVQLFVQRASMVDREFTLSPSVLPAVLEVCARLDGQPLALELAAARLNTLTVGQVAARLSDRFRLLTGGSRTALPRHRTLRAVVEWSWDLLNDDERALASRVAVFPGGVTESSALAVMTPGTDVGALLESLADKSLLVAVRGETTRFRMLETLREFGIERLVDEGSISRVRSDHLDYFVAYATRCDAIMRGPDQLVGFADLDAERANLNAALRFAIDERDQDRAQQLVSMLAWYWTARGQHIEAATWGVAAVAIEGAADPTAEIICRALAVTATYGRSEPTDVSVHTDRILELQSRYAIEDQRVVFIVNVMKMFGISGDIEIAPPYDDWTRAAVTLTGVLYFENSGNAEHSASLLDEVIAGFAASGDRWGLATAVRQRGNVEAARGDFEAARASWRRAISMLVELGADDEVFEAQMWLIHLEIAFEDGVDLAVSRSKLADLIDAAAARGSRQNELMGHLAMTRLELRAGDHEAAAARARMAVEIHGSGFPYGAGQIGAMVVGALASVELAQGKLAEAQAHIRDAMAQAIASSDMPVVANVAVFAACLRARQGDLRAAAVMLGAADRIRGAGDLSNWDARNLTKELREVLGSDAFVAAYSRGFALDQAEARALASV